jgi:iron complex transport system substrate-binding protein
MNTSTIFVLMMLFTSSAPIVLPAVASDYTLGIYGNANMDDTIDEEDIEYVEGIIEGTNEATELADANYDGEIDEDDIAQIEMIISGDERELTLIDSADRIVTVGQPIKSIAGLHTSPCREFCMLGVEDKVVGVTKYTFDDLDLYPRLADKANICSVSEPDYEIIVEIKPDVLIMTSGSTLPDVVRNLEPTGIKVIALDLCTPDTYDSELKQLGYLVDKEERAEDFIQWRHEIIELIGCRTDDLEDGEKARVFPTALTPILNGENEFSTDFTNGKTANRIIELAEGTNIAEELPAGIHVSGEWILEENPDVIILSAFWTKDGFGYSVTDETLANQSLRTVLDNEVISKTNAAREGNVYIFGYYGTASGGQHPLGALYLAKRIYPERFEDIDPESFHREYFEKWFNIEHQGVWVYPRIAEVVETEIIYPSLN